MKSTYLVRNLQIKIYSSLEIFNEFENLRKTLCCRIGEPDVRWFRIIRRNKRLERDGRVVISFWPLRSDEMRSRYCLLWTRNQPLSGLSYEGVPHEWNHPRNKRGDRVSGMAEIVQRGRRQGERERERERRKRRNKGRRLETVKAQCQVSTGTWHKYIIHLCGGVSFQGVPRQSFIFDLWATLGGPLRERRRTDRPGDRCIFHPIVAIDLCVDRIVCPTAPHEA